MVFEQTGPPHPSSCNALMLGLILFSLLSPFYLLAFHPALGMPLKPSFTWPLSIIYDAHF